MKEQWECEKKQLLGEKAILQDTTHKLNLQVRSAQDEAKRFVESGKAAQKAKVSVQAVSLILSASRFRAHFHFTRQQELDTARQSISALESELRTERSKLRSLLTEQDRFERERESVLTKLRRTESVRDTPRTKHRNYEIHLWIIGHGRRKGESSSG